MIHNESVEIESGMIPLLKVMTLVVRQSITRPDCTMFAGGKKAGLPLPLLLLQVRFLGNRFVLFLFLNAVLYRTIAICPLPAGGLRSHLSVVPFCSFPFAHLHLSAGGSDCCSCSISSL